MAWIEAAQPFDADGLPGEVIGIASLLGRHDSGFHRHRRHQLLFAASGCMTIALEGARCLLPPSRAAWIPGGVSHRALMRGQVAYRSLYFEAPLAGMGASVQVLEVNPLLREVIERMAAWPWDFPAARQQALLQVFAEELNAAKRESWQLAMPRDRRLANWLAELGEGKAPPRLNQLADGTGACERTISRIFLRDTGMSYQAWRQQWRLLKAMEQLADGEEPGRVAQALDFSSDSAFIAFFSRHVGQTPAQYRRAAGAQSSVSR
ncbi:helix-turn-helix domain-containing protein [Chromobacterium sp. IIBBL 290-4]|uniref:AraC family transcriptional regulator n=1 Tax=Chromobacterium sp. IIBBL 290-4 TaxID=2953890 RepID=UPI0020B66306|nr:helix-turn-helix transcriptional regulator [Chromobacterium sp. IIBBL 290-4]UTH74558.1 helix-turn-helix transcriptional regulator [Chromobacterium sp. IIBBL 290-4]